MNFNSLAEYFYKLYNICLLLMLLPLAVFLTLYYMLDAGKLISVISPDHALSGLLVLLFPLFIVLELTIVHLVLQKKLVPTQSELSLGTRLDQYYSFVLIKSGGAAFVGILMAVGLYLTGRGLFSAYFLLVLVWIFIQWPTPRKVSKDLKLKGDEQEMVLTKGEAFK